MSRPHNKNRSGSLLAPKFPIRLGRQAEAARGSVGPHSRDAAGEHAVILTSLDGIITDWSPGAERSFGYHRHEALGQSLDILVPSHATDDHRHIMEQAARGIASFRAGAGRLDKTGRLVDVRLTAFPLRDPLGLSVGIITVTHDLAEFRHLEKQLRLAQTLDAFGQLAGGIVHDFNNLLTVILGYSEILLCRTNDCHDVAELVGEIRDAGLCAESLTRQLLSWTRTQDVESEAIDLNAVIDDTAKMLRRLIGADIVMTTILCPTLKAARIEVAPLRQIVINLAINARDAMPHGGRLTIETANVTPDEASPPVRAGHYVMLAVSDTGVGMTPDVQARIFEPFFTTKPSGQGTGLGLATVHAIVRQSGGQIAVHSDPGRGAAFRVFLPQIHEPLRFKRPAAPLHLNPRGDETVLLVEDEDTVRKFIQHVLNACGYLVLSAPNGPEALALAERHAASIDLLVSDVVMPVLGGRALAERLLKKRPTLRVLFLSGYTNDMLVHHGVSELEFAFLQKPFSTAALAQKIRDVLDSPANGGFMVSTPRRPLDRK